MTDDTAWLDPNTPFTLFEQDGAPHVRVTGSTLGSRSLPLIEMMGLWVNRQRSFVKASKPFFLVFVPAVMIVVLVTSYLSRTRFESPGSVPYMAMVAISLIVIGSHIAIIRHKLGRIIIDGQEGTTGARKAQDLATAYELTQTTQRKRFITSVDPMDNPRYNANASHQVKSKPLDHIDLGYRPMPKNSIFKATGCNVLILGESYVGLTPPPYFWSVWIIMMGIIPIAAFDLFTTNLASLAVAGGVAVLIGPIGMFGLLLGGETNGGKHVDLIKWITDIGLISFHDINEGIPSKARFDNIDDITVHFRYEPRRFIEESDKIKSAWLGVFQEERVPRDATIVGYTWQYANMDGSRDGRFNDNERLAQTLMARCAYSLNGFETPFELSSVENAEKAVGLLSPWQ